jgi:alpha-L-glutamate ligase-like protein
MSVATAYGEGSAGVREPVARGRLAPAWRGYDDVVGMNARNAHIARSNPLPSVRLVTDKAATKWVLERHDVPVARTIGVVTEHRWARRVTLEDLPAEWVMKPNRGHGGNGVLIADRSDADGWLRASGRRLPLRAVRDHLRLVLDGEFSGRARDAALLEPVIRADGGLARLSYQGLPDIRVICEHDEPRLAMLRLPTSRSGGRANLHQGAVGAAVDIDTGRVVAARAGRHATDVHPDTLAPLLGAQVPSWGQVLAAASRCGPATGLHYVGADVVIDESRGPLVLEVNARPGLQIQNVTARGLSRVLRRWSR